MLNKKYKLKYTKYAGRKVNVVATKIVKRNGADMLIFTTESGHEIATFHYNDEHKALRGEMVMDLTVGRNEEKHTEFWYVDLGVN